MLLRRDERCCDARYSCTATLNTTPTPTPIPTATLPPPPPTTPPPTPTANLTTPPHPSPPPQSVGLVPPPFMDASVRHVPTCQMEFLELVAAPLFLAMARLVPGWRGNLKELGRNYR